MIYPTEENIKENCLSQSWPQMEAKKEANLDNKNYKSILGGV